jgi:hypothetical protein
MNNRGEDAQYRLDVCCPASQVICLTLSRLNGSPRTGKFIERVVGTRKSEGNSTAEFASYSSLPQHFCEKYGADHEKKCHQNRSLENPYRTVAVQRFGERGPRENASGVDRGFGSPEVCSEIPAKRGFSHHVQTNQRNFATTRLAEGVELGSNILRAPAKPAGGSRCKFCMSKI